jgi:hypothetical protein
MIVYGDPQFTIGSTALLHALRKSVFSTGVTDLDELRSLLIQAGQFEQAMADYFANPKAQSIAQRMTDLAASAFQAVYAGGGGGVAAGEALEQLRKAIPCPADFPDVQVIVKIPEGFEFYALYPEQYCNSALQWSADKAGSEPERSVAIVGIRSIGTTLSAVVGAILAGAGWRTGRITVRPSGPPFERTVELPAAFGATTQYALVVDEGPGLSGSSMAAVAQALVASGFKREQIAFLPGHANEPGPAASPEVRDWWAHTPRYVTSLENIRWKGLTLAESLEAKAGELSEAEITPHFLGVSSSAKPQRLLRTENLGRGLWRNMVYASETNWPAVPGSFERLKYRCSPESGAGLLWKFAGLGAWRYDGESCVVAAFNRIEERAAHEWTVKPVAVFRGFVGLPWIEGKPLRIEDARAPGILNRIGCYSASVSGPPLTGTEQAEALARLTEMLYWNTKESLGVTAAERTLRVAGAIHLDDHHPSHGDGHLAPHEWLRTVDGRILKVDCAGHDTDHTVIGRQPIHWDIAGAIVEWKLTEAQVGGLLKAIKAAGIEIEPSDLAFYRLAFAAFRLGQSALCASLSTEDPSERARFEAATWRYQNQLQYEVGRIALSDSSQPCWAFVLQ